MIQAQISLFCRLCLFHITGGSKALVITLSTWHALNLSNGLGQHEFKMYFKLFSKIPEKSN